MSLWGVDGPTNHRRLRGQLGPAPLPARRWQALAGQQGGCGSGWRRGGRAGSGGSWSGPGIRALAWAGWPPWASGWAPPAGRDGARRARRL